MKQCIRHFVRPKKGRDDSVVARKLMLLVALAAMWLAPQCVYAQGAQYTTIALNVLGHPLAGVSIAVCNSTATIGSAATPCSPLVTIYTDETLSTVAPNPFTADSLGNYTFYAQP